VILFLLSFCRVGIDIPTIEVRYENLSIVAEAHVGNRGLPTILNSTMNTLEVLQKRSMFIILIKDMRSYIFP
jgi:hypothetical protein